MDRELWQEWKRIFFTGTEWENHKKILQSDWDFAHLKNFIEEDHERSLYIFGTTEAHLIDNEVVIVPVVVAVMIDFAPREIGIKSVMRNQEFIVPMEEYKLTWSVWLRKKNGKHVYYLQSYQRPFSAFTLPLERRKNFDYLLPYIWIPEKEEDEDTVVEIVDVLGGVGINFEYDWEFDDMDEIIEDVLESRELSQAYAEDLKKIIEENVKRAKKEIRMKRRERKKRLDSLPVQVAEQLKNLKTYKFYPLEKRLRNFKSSTINRYYGKATVVF